MSDFIQIQWTTGSIEEARKVCRFLVQEKIVACAQIVPWIESIYLWNKQLETEQETKVVLKTHAQSYERVREVIMQNTKYELPEITWVEIAGGNEEYMKWLEDSVKEPVPQKV